MTSSEQSATPVSPGDRRAPMWPAALSLGLTAGLALLLGTVGYFMVGFG